MAEVVTAARTAFAKRTIAIALCLIVTAATLAFFHYPWSPTQELTGFVQSADHLTLTFRAPVSSVRVARLPYVPATVDPLGLRETAEVLSAKDSSIWIALHPEPSEGEYSIFLFVGTWWVELVRQSPGWLYTKFSFLKTDGYTILGRRSMVVSAKPAISLPKLVFTGMPALLPIKPTGISEYPEVRMALGLFNYLWNQPIRLGPIALSYADFVVQPFQRKLDLMRAGEFAVMCQGMRDLFLHAAAGVPNLKVRAVEAFNYNQSISNLISYSHSTAEIYVASLSRWVLFDPWLGIMVADANGIPVGSAELQSEQRNQSKFHLVALADELPRMYRRADGRVVQSVYYPSNTQITRFSCEELGCSPGYAEYFRVVVFREHEVTMPRG